jgi:DNA-binding HxlR family transcriptional regulator
MGLRMRRSRVPAPPPACPLMECMKLLGGAWTPNVIWYLSECPRRFGELRADIPLVSAKVLTARLRALESKGVVNRRVVASSPPSVEYSLTDLGRELIPVIRAIIRVGEKLKMDAANRTTRTRTAASAQRRRETRAPAA